jgi:transcriptional regulator with XRE-family HTH domain
VYRQGTPWAAGGSYRRGMDNRSEVREFLNTRRARIEPHDVDLPAGANRRVPGLRRSEVAMLAGVSIEYYARLERGDLAGASESVLDAIARALHLDDAERGHLFDLARAANESPLVRPRRRAARTVSSIAQRMLDAVTEAPAFLSNGRGDLLATNRLARAFYAPAYLASGSPPNFARFQFLDLDRSHAFYADWDVAADITVANLRTEAGRDPHSRELQDLVGELSTRSDEFRRRWGAHNVRRHSTGVKAFHHPVVGDLTLQYQVAELVGEPGLALTIYTAEPGSASEANLRLLASWAATEEQASAAPSAVDPA